MRRYMKRVTSITRYTFHETFHITLHVTKRNVKFSSRDERNVYVTLNFRMERERNVKFYKRDA